MEEPTNSNGSEAPHAALRDLGSKNKKKRELAQQQLERLGADSIDEVVSLVRAEAEKRRKRRRNLKVCLTLYLTFVGVCIAIWVGNGAVTGNWGHFPKQIFNSFSSFAALSAMLAASQSQKAGTEWLAQFNDPRAIGPLLDALTLNDNKLEEVAWSALKRLLPEMKREHAMLLSPDHRGILRNQLKTEDRDFQVAVLRALPIIEDFDFLPAIESLVQDLERQAEPDSVLLTTARDSLSDLKELQQHERERETLLRPSGPVEEIHLLRPVTSSAESEPEKLLRAADSA